MRDYATMRNCLTDEIEFDYTALFGTQMPPTADELVENVRLNHQGLKGLQHIRGLRLNKIPIRSEKSLYPISAEFQNVAKNRGTALIPAVAP
jgi:hypothetical protein